MRHNAGMLTSAHRRKLNTVHNQRGFSLLELLVVIVIIGILVSIAAINIDTRDTRPQKQAERLAALIELAADEAMIHGQEMGLHFYLGQYEFSVFDPERGIWIIMTNDEMFMPRRLEEAVTVDLVIEDREIVLVIPELNRKTDAVDENYEPQIFILSSGEITPFTASFKPEFDDNGYMLDISLDGKATVTAIGNDY